MSVYVLWGKTKDIVTLMGLYSKEEYAEKVGKAFVKEKVFDKYTIEMWAVLDSVEMI